MFKYIRVLFSILLIFVLCSCAEIATFYGAPAQPNIEANCVLKASKRIQTLQFECINHPEYQHSFPSELRNKYSSEEIIQVFQNLNWEIK